MSVERDLQRSAIGSFTSIGYEYLGTHLAFQRPQSDLDANFRTHFERLNRDKLTNGRLTDTEYARLITAFPHTIRGGFEALRHGLTMTLDNNDVVNLIFFDTRSPENNVYQVTEELTVETITRNRLDLVTLVNGIPFSAIELKRPGTREGVQEAVNQVNRYSGQGVYQTPFMRFLQFFVVSNGVTTKYFSVNPATDDSTDRNKHGAQQFRWTGKDNQAIYHLEPFIRDFYQPELIHKILTHYMLLTPEDKGNALMILRPYQLYAVEAAAKRTEESENCLIWHATGSGKTLTSFILSRTLAETPENHKVVMLLDRNDLADQTLTEFAKFDPDLANAIVRGTRLRAAVRSDSTKLILSTIQSFSKFVRRYKRTTAKISQKRFVFIIDECHRSTFGSMFHALRANFPNSVFIGFTGTPIMPETAKDGELDTQSLFGAPAHVYTIREAIDDKNVLEFQVQTAGDPAPATTTNLTSAYYAHPDRIAANSRFIASSLPNHTRQGDEVKNNTTSGYTAMLAAQNKNAAYAYWQALTPLLAAQNRKTALILSVDDNHEDTDGEGVSLSDKERYMRVLQAHDETWGTSFTLTARTSFDDARRGHLADVMNRVKNWDPDAPEDTIDLLIVSDMLLTGFDAKPLNTLYLDKKLRYHGLLQAMSRTNRVETRIGRKHVGNVILFQDRDMEEDINDTIRLFSSGDNLGTTSGIIRHAPFAEVIHSLQQKVMNLRSLAPRPEDAGDVREAGLLHLISVALGDVRHSIDTAQIYTEWNSGRDHARIGITPDDVDRYYSCLQEAISHVNPRTEDDEEALAEVQLTIEDQGGFVIDVSYITRLLYNYVNSPEHEKRKWVSKAERSLAALRSSPKMGARDVAAIEATLEACKRGEVADTPGLLERLSQERQRVTEALITESANGYGVSYAQLSDWVEYYEFTGAIPTTIIESLSDDMGLLERYATVTSIETLLVEKF